ncbi:hypothetical protein D7X33_52925, partial [Butyricicoccus sp. 1XD8-22]
RICIYLADFNGHDTAWGGEKLLIKLVAIILIGKCLLLLTDDKDFIIYIKLATLIIFLTTMLDFLNL